MKLHTLALAALAAPLQAQTVDVIEQLPNHFLFTYSDQDCDVCGGSFSAPTQTLAENFNVVTPSVFQLEEIVIWGVHDNGSPTDPNVFELRILDDINGLPGGAVYSETLLPFSTVVTGVQIAGESEVEVTLRPSGSVQLPTGTYWVEIYNDTASTTASWAWISADLDSANGIDGSAFSPDIPASPWFGDNYLPGGPARNLSLRISGTGAQPGGPIQPYCFGVGCPCGNDDAGAGCANSTSAGASLTFQGSAVAAQDDLVFQAFGLPNGQPALLIAGENAPGGGSGVLFGDGLRCAGMNVRRLGAVNADGSGSASWGPGLAAGQGWVSGDLRYFQVWYRDPAGSACGSAFNLSNGLEVIWQ